MLHGFIERMRLFARCLGVADRRLGESELGVAVDHEFECRARPARTLLRNVGDDRVGGDAELAVVGFEFAEQHGDE